MQQVSINIRAHMQEGRPGFQSGATDEQATLPCAGEVFLLRKLLPQTADYDFNVHVMDFLPGEFLNVKVRFSLYAHMGGIASQFVLHHELR